MERSLYCKSSSHPFQLEVVGKVQELSQHGRRGTHWSLAQSDLINNWLIFVGIVAILILNANFNFCFGKNALVLQRFLQHIFLGGNLGYNFQIYESNNCLIRLWQSEPITRPQPPCPVCVIIKRFLTLCKSLYFTEIFWRSTK